MCELGSSEARRVIRSLLFDYYHLYIYRYVMSFYFTPFQISFLSKRSSLVSAITLADVFPNFSLLP